MPTPVDPEQTWLIEQFLRGNLPASVHGRVNERMTTDAAFERQVMAQWLVLDYLDHQGQITTFYEAFDSVIVAAGQRKETGSHKGIHILFQLLGVAAVVLLCLGLGMLAVRYNSPPQRQVSSLPLNVDDDNYGFSDGEDSVLVVQYDRLPGFWDFGDQYTWKGDTLAIYGPSLGQSLTKSWRITPTRRRNTYLLTADKQTYSLLKGQTNLTPLKPNENP